MLPVTAMKRSDEDEKLNTFQAMAAKCTLTSVKNKTVQVKFSRKFASSVTTTRCQS